MAEYATNSHKSKELVEVPTENKLEPVVSGAATTQKRSGLSKFVGGFIAEGIENVGSYLLSDVLIPAIKKTVDDVVSNGVHMLLYGKAAESKGVTASKISYNSFYNKYNSEPVRAGSYSAFDYDNILFSNRGDAEAVLEAMDDIIDRYGIVSVGEYYELSDVPVPNYTVNKYGWKNISTAQIKRSNSGDGYFIKLPRAVVID